VPAAYGDLIAAVLALLALAALRSDKIRRSPKRSPPPYRPSIGPVGASRNGRASRTDAARQGDVVTNSYPKLDLLWDNLIAGPWGGGSAPQCLAQVPARRFPMRRVGTPGSGQFG